MEHANQYIKVGMAFLDAISRLDENRLKYVSPWRIQTLFRSSLDYLLFS